METPLYRVAQPYGRAVEHESTTISEHTTAAEAFAEIDRLAAQMARTGALSDAITLRREKELGVLRGRAGWQSA